MNNMAMPTTEALKYLRKAHKMDLTVPAFLYHVRNRNICVPTTLRIGGRYFFTEAILDEFAQKKRDPGRPTVKSSPSTKRRKTQK